MRMKQLAYAIGLIGLAGISVVHADDQQPAKTEKIEVTGSSIKRIAKEGALPVTTLTQEDIKKSGATSATDLIQMLPSMQGFVPASSSVNGGGAGVTTAALHALPSKYTLVLLDGQRLAPSLMGATQGGGFAVNLESIPLDAVERVEVLADGASALYGSDAIAGVVNFITKKNKTDGNLFFNYSDPQHPGGNSWSAGVSKGWGSLDTDGWNVLITASHDQQQKLTAAQRSFSQNGAYFQFDNNGQKYLYNAATSNTEPANLTFSAVPKGSPNGTLPTAYSLNPYYTANGNCGANAVPIFLNVPASATAGAQTGVSCRFNYAATVDDIPLSRRDSGMLKVTWKLNDNTTLWSDLVLSRFDMTAAYAPPAQPEGVTATRNPTLYNNYILPYLNANGLSLTYTDAKGNTTTSQPRLGYRAVAAGDRADEYKILGTQWSTGIDGSFGGWDYNASLTVSSNKMTDVAAGGYADNTMLSGLIQSGAYDPVMDTGTTSVHPTLLNGQFFQGNQYNLNVFHAGVQHELFDMAGGSSVLAFNGEYQQHHFKITDSSLYQSQSGFSTQPASTDYPVGGNYGQVPLDASRDNWGLGAEWLLPVLKNLDVTLSTRYDSYAKTHSNYVFSTAVDPVTGLFDQLPSADLGNTFSDTTYKASFRYTPLDNLLLRGSYGTGFKAPNMNDIAGPVTFSGSTSGSYTCPFPGSSTCLPGSAQYDLLAGGQGASGAAGLKPEKSTQWTVGFRYEPIRSLSLGLDLWNVQIKHQVQSQGYAEQYAFANPSAVPSYLWQNPYNDPNGVTTIAFEQLPFNGGVANYRGVDWDFSYRMSTPFGKLASSFTGTEMLKQNYTYFDGDIVHSDLGQYGPDQEVVFRTQAHLVNTLQTGAFANTLTINYKSGYHDAVPAAGVVYLVNADGSTGPAASNFGGLTVPSYTTIDWQTKYDYSKVLTMTFGIKNVLDHNPPLTLQNAGGGNQVGYDGRYADPLGRTFYLGGNWKF